MIDHLLTFDDEQAARDALPDYTTEAGWNESIVIPAVRIIVTDAVWDDGEIVTPEVLVPGFHLIIAERALNEQLRDLDNYPCRLITDRETAIRGQPFTLYMAPDMNMEVFAVARVEPTFAGSGYPFGVG